MNRTISRLTVVLAFFLSPAFLMAQGSQSKTVSPEPCKTVPAAGTATSDMATSLAIDFEAETAWTFVFTPWTAYDNDLLPTYGMTGYTWPNSGDPQAFIVFDPATASPSLSGDPDIQPHGGTQFGACMAAIPSGGQGNDDWFISDLVAITASGASFTFWAKSYTDTYGLEQFNVGVSTTGTSPSDFSIISGSTAVSAPTTWTEYTYDLSSYAGQSIHVAIQCVSYDAFIFMIDDLVIDPDGSGGGGSSSCDDFDNLNAGDYVALSLPDWDTWSGSPGSSDDGQVSAAASYSSPHSVKVDGLTDLLRMFGSSNLTSGRYEFTTRINVATGSCGYFNLQKDVLPGTEWGFEVQFDADGTATVNAGGDGAATFSFAHGTWHENEVIVDLDANWAEYYFNGNLIIGWQWLMGSGGTPGAMTLGSANLYAWASTGNSPLAYYDDVCFNDITVFEPDIYVNPTAVTVEPGVTKKSPSTTPDHGNWEQTVLTGDYLPGKVVLRFHESVEVYENTGMTNMGSLNSLSKHFKVSALKAAFPGNGKNENLKARFGLPYIYVADFNSGDDMLSVLKAWSDNPYVVYAEPEYIYRHCTVPPDPMYPDQWGLNNTGQAQPYGGGAAVGTPGADINAEAAWDIQTGSSSIIVAIIDEGVDTSHPEFSGRLLPGYDFYDNDPDPNPVGDGAHGTACAGIAAAASDGVGTVGVAWNVTILPVRVLGSGGGTSTQVANGITYSADEGAHVLSLSLGGTGYSSTMESAVNYAYATDAIILSAAGNDNQSNTVTPHYPSDYANSISVGALSPCNDRKSPTTCDGETWWGSNYAGTLDFMAPGARIYTTDISGSAGYSSTNYTSTFNGTSSACPFAAGVAALIRSENSSLTNAQVWDIMQTTCVDLETGGYDEQTGWGRINAYDALLAAGGSVVNNQFNIQNVGNALLSISSITDDQTWLSTSGYPATPFTLTPGAGQDVTIDVDWSLVGAVQQTGTITVASDDPDEPQAYITVTAIPGPAPDLVVLHQQALPAVLQPGEVLNASCTVKNTGDTLAEASELQYFLSDDDSWDPADTWLGTDNVGALAVGDSSLQDQDLSIPAATAAGNHYILFFADAQEVVPESNENNNVAASLITVVLPDTADLLVQNAQLTPATANAGETVSASCTVSNTGGATAGASTLEYYLSADTVWDASDTYLAYSDIDSLQAGQSQNAGSDLLIPAATQAGNYYVIYFADAGGVVDESDEDNNFAHNALVVTTVEPYIIVDPGIQNVGYQQGYFVANVYSNVSWQVSESCDWLSCDPVSGQNDDEFAVIYDENGTGSIRSYTITVSGDGASDNLTVVQDYLIGLPEQELLSGLAVYPNPFGSKVVVEYTLASPQEVVLELYNATGVRVRSHVEKQQAGRHTLVWQLSGLPAGLYHYRLQSGEAVLGGSMIKE